MNDSDPEILLITNTVYPYHLHNVAVLSLPFGGTYHFRYERRYFHCGEEDLENLRGRTGILVLRDFQRATFIPLRAFRVLAVDDCGDLVFLDLEFLDFVEYRAGRSEIGAPTTANADELLREREKYTNTVAVQILATGVRNEKNQHLEKLILLSNPSELRRVSRTHRTSNGGTASAIRSCAAILTDGYPPREAIEG